jgi:hypothetical protein
MRSPTAVQRAIDVLGDRCCRLECADLPQLYFRGECGFDSQDLRVLADFAFKIYDGCRQTAIPEKELTDFYSGPGQSLQQRIDGKGLIHRLGAKDFEFRHQVLHDFLVALKEASSTEREDEILLRARAFNIVSLDSAVARSN